MPLQNSIPIDNGHVFKEDGTNFIPLTDQDSFGGLFDKIINKTANSKHFWATVGRKDNGALLGSWQGKIVCSREGNNSFTTRGKQIQAEAETLRALFPEMNPANKKTIVEKFISFDDVIFETDPRARMLRLTVLVKDDEYALTFLQHTKKDDLTTQNGVFGYLLPERFEDSGKRRRLTYYFEVPPTSADGNSRFVIKVITYRGPAIAKMSKAERDTFFRRVDNSYAINLYNPALNQFRRLPENEIAAKIDPAKKTLLLFHGTFASVQGSYGDLLDNNWLGDLIKKGKYQQVLGFDHPTVIDSPATNAAELFRLLKPVIKFAEPVDIITTSRGGLVGKYVVNDKKQTLLKIERAATVACANGVQWISTGQEIGKLLGYFKLTSHTPLGMLLLALSQLAVEEFLAQPGLDIMDKKNADLKLLLQDSPANPDMRYYPLCGDYRTRGNHPIGWKFFDLLLSVIMVNGSNDWVVETDNQVIMPPKHYAYSLKGHNESFYRKQPADATHTRYFFDAMTKDTKTRIFDFLHDEGSVL